MRTTRAEQPYASLDNSATPRVPLQHVKYTEGRQHNALPGVKIRSKLTNAPTHHLLTAIRLGAKNDSGTIEPEGTDKLTVTASRPSFSRPRQGRQANLYAHLSTTASRAHFVEHPYALIW